MSLCNLGVMGTKYVRSAAIRDSVKIKRGEPFTLVVENIAAHHDYAIGNELNI